MYRVKISLLEYILIFNFRFEVIEIFELKVYLKSHGKATFDLNVSKIINIKIKIELFNDREILVLSEKYFIESFQHFVQKIIESEVHILFRFRKRVSVKS